MMKKNKKTEDLYLGKSKNFWLLFASISFVAFGLMYIITSGTTPYRKSSYLVIIESITPYSKDTVCYKTTGAMLDVTGNSVIGVEPPELIYSEVGKYNVGDTALIVEDQSVGEIKIGATIGH